MKILFVAPRFPLPANTGAKIRTFNLLRQAAEDSEVTLLAFAFGEVGHKYIQDLNKYGIEVYLVKAKENINPFTIFSDKPISIEKYRSKEMEDKLKSLISSKNFDLVHFDHLHMAQYKDYINGLPSILDEHNIESVILNRCADINRNIAKRQLFKSQARKMINLEVKLASRVTKCVVVSNNDKDNLSSLLGQNGDIAVIPNGVDTDYFRPQTANRTAQTENALVFIGSMDWLPNSDAVEYFCKDILPLIWKVKKEVKFYIVGKNPARNIMELEKKDRRIEVTGEIKDVRPYIEKAKVFVVPMRIGGGTRLKILEAMSMQKDVVSTSLGAEGIEYAEDVNIILADNPQIFADKVISLLENEKKAREIGFKSRELVCEKYNWDIIGKKLIGIYNEALNVR
jgi:sugar transferase (PEP-CTERM/EpsH1 system associated)